MRKNDLGLTLLALTANAHPVKLQLRGISLTQDNI